MMSTMRRIQANTAGKRRLTMSIEQARKRAQAPVRRQVERRLVAQFGEQIDEGGGIRCVEHIPADDEHLVVSRVAAGQRLAEPRCVLRERGQTDLRDDVPGLTQLGDDLLGLGLRVFVGVGQQLTQQPQRAVSRDALLGKTARLHRALELGAVGLHQNDLGRVIEVERHRTPWAERARPCFDREWQARMRRPETDHRPSDLFVLCLRRAGEQQKRRRLDLHRQLRRHLRCEVGPGDFLRQLGLIGIARDAVFDRRLDRLETQRVDLLVAFLGVADVGDDRFLFDLSELAELGIPYEPPRGSVLVALRCFLGFRFRFWRRLRFWCCGRGRCCGASNQRVALLHLLLDQLVVRFAGVVLRVEVFGLRLAVGADATIGGGE